MTVIRTPFIVDLVPSLLTIWSFVVLKVTLSIIGASIRILVVVTTISIVVMVATI